MIRRIHHVQITIPVGQEEKGRAFYCGLLGMTEMPKPSTMVGRGGLWLATGDNEFHIGVEDGIDRGATKGHVALQVDDYSGIGTPDGSSRCIRRPAGRNGSGPLMFSETIQ